jgi:hypothetical protein
LVNVSSKDDKPLPAGLRVEISGQESVCGSLNSNDAKAPVDDKGKAMFRDLPGCKVTVKINSNQYLPVRKAVDLAGYRSCAAAAPKEHGEDGPPQAPCEPILLVLDPLT